MASPLSISTDTSSEIALIRQQIADLKAGRPTEAAYAGRSRISGGRIGNDYSGQIAALEERLAYLLNPSTSTLGPNITSAPEVAPVFAGARIDVGRVGVGDLKLLSYPGI